MKKVKKNKKITLMKIVRILCVILVLFIISLILVYNYLNFNLYKRITALSDEDQIQIYYDLDYLVLWDKTVEYLKTTNKEFVVKESEYEIKYNSEDIEKVTNLDSIKVTTEDINYENINGVKGLVIDFSKIKNLNSINSFSIAPTEEIKAKKYLDVYYLDLEGKAVLYKSFVSLESNKISFEIFKDDEGNIKEKYICVNIPVTDLKIASESLQMENKASLKIDASVLPENATNKNILYECVNEDSIAISSDGVITTKNVGDFEINVTTEDGSIRKTIKLKVRGISSSISKDELEATYVNGILLVNKVYGLSPSYNPGIDQTALTAFKAMKADASKSGIYFNVFSDYRSYQTQVWTYWDYVRNFGQASADTFSAKPGYSEHQTGLAFDIGTIDYSYGSTLAGKWLTNNAHRFGFILRYPKNKQAITGYRYEPWHFRYVGNPDATNIYNSGLCLEEYLNIF